MKFALLCAVILSFLLAPNTQAAFGDRIAVSGMAFKAGSDRIWINGANTPWHHWNDFGGEFDAAWWDHHLQLLHESGINATRVWTSCNGETGINIASNGWVSGCTEAFWKNVDTLLQLAAKRQVYIDATLISFDHFSNYHPRYQSWRRMLADDQNIDSMVTNYVLSFALRYQDNPWLWSIDLCNEPDWIHETAKCGKLPWDGFQTYVAKSAAAIHSQTKILVTVGLCMGPKYTQCPPGTNILSDQALQARDGGGAGARLDFYSPHYYDWMRVLNGNAFYQTPAEYGLDASKPIVIGECPAKGTSGHTIVDDYEAAFSHGWQGVMAWTSNGVDTNGSLTDLGFAVKAVRARHAALVFPKP